ncbi:MAG: T9SS type A sorting domain-containing protein, partial [Saprospiraceae bacterium]
LRKMIDSGMDVNITIEAPYIVDVAANYAWSTPVEQVIPLDSIRMVLLNRDTVAIDDVTASVTITDPSGNATTFTEIAGTIDPYTSFAQVSGEYLVKFSEAYTPTEVGEYTATFTASTPDGVHPINQESRTVQFRVTDDHTFAIDNGEIDVEEGLSIYPQAYIDSAGVYFVGALYRMGQNDAVATHATFGISNPQELAPGFKIFANIYDADFDLNGQVDDITPLISDPEGSATYTLTGDEIPNQLITVEFDQPVQLGAGGIYVLFFENEGTGSHGPALSATGGPDFPGYSAVLQLGSQYELDGWEFWNDDTPGLPHGGRRPVARLHLDGFVGTQDLPPLDPSKIAVQPVPATDFITLTLDLDKVANEVNVGMLDFSGRIVRTEKLENVQHGNFSFDVSQLSAGTYFLSVITPEGFRSKKFQVVR